MIGMLMIDDQAIIRVGNFYKMFFDKAKSYFPF